MVVSYDEINRNAGVLLLAIKPLNVFTVLIYRRSSLDCYPSQGG